MAEKDSVSLEPRVAASAFVPLPIRHGGLLRVLGPKPDEAAVAVELLVKVDQALTVVQSYMGGLCDARGQLVEPLEVTLVVDPGTVVPHKQVPAAAVLGRFNALPELRCELAVTSGFETLSAVIGEPQELGPLLYCRKRQCIFAARSPRTGGLLQAVPPEHMSEVSGADRSELPVELVSWDGPAEGETGPKLYGGRGGSSSLGKIASLDELMLEQGSVVALVGRLENNDPDLAARLATEHACVKCPERGRCYPKDAGYAYAADRLVAISAVNGPVMVAPLGEWCLEEAARIIGGLAPGQCAAGEDMENGPFQAWRRERARAMESIGPARLLAGENDGRDLIEVARLKLGLIAGVMEQLDAAWQASGRPHLCWNGETVRVAWRQPGLTAGMCWGFRPLLRRAGLQPDAPIESPDGRELPYPPAFSDAAYLASSTADAARYFGEPRKATLFVKTSSPEGDGVRVRVLLEELGIRWDLFCTGDAMHVTGDGWQAVLAPAAERDPNDGEGLPFVGRAAGRTAGLKKGEQLESVECRWYARFGEAVDLHAVGVLLFEALLSHDERSTPSLRGELAKELAELAAACCTLPIEQRDGQVRAWVTERCEADAPAAIWTRRNLLYRRDDRNATRLDAFGASLWQEIVTFGLRMTTSIAGFSYCADRGGAAPRLNDGPLLPLVELQGMIALLDDQLYGRTAPGAAVREAFKT